MNTRGQYGSASPGRVHVGAFLVHALELRQRYNNVSAAAAQALLNDLSRGGTVLSVGDNRWEIALKEGTWVKLAWHPHASALEITITDRELRPVDQLTDARHRHETLLQRLTPQLQSYGATTVGAAFVGHASQLPQDRSIAGVDGRGYYGSRRAMVGLTLYHSVGDRAEAVKQMDVDWNTLYQSLASQAGELIADPKSASGYRYMTQLEWNAHPPDPKKVEWWKSYASPLIQQWVKFKHDQLGGDRTVAADYIAFAERFQTDWDVYENWKKKLDNLRKEAEKRGFTVDAAPITALPTTVWADVGDVIQRGAGKVAAGVGDVWNVVKYGAYAVLGIGAVVALTSVASNLRSGKDPGEKYMELIRESRRPRTPRALPPRRPQLALPSGPEPEGA